jgi:hypothetical protein
MFRFGRCFSLNHVTASFRRRGGERLFMNAADFGELARENPMTLSSEPGGTDIAVFFVGFAAAGPDLARTFPN